MKWIILLLIPIATQAEIKISLEKNLWTELKFNNIKPNQVSYLPSEIVVNVDSSASPLIYKLEEPVNISGFEVSLNFTGKMSDAAGFEEDSYFRFGVVATGDEKLSTLGSWFAPGWVKQLFALAPKGVGLDKIYFFNVANSAANAGKERPHPSSRYLFERVIAVKSQDAMQINYKLSVPLKAAALWISIDGDNTKSKFTTEIKSIKLENL